MNSVETLIYLLMRDHLSVGDVCALVSNASWDDGYRALSGNTLAAGPVSDELVAVAKRLASQLTPRLP